QSILQVRRKDLLESGGAERFDRRATFGRLPGFVGSDACLEVVPLGFGELAAALAENRSNGFCVQGGKRTGPCRVDALEERQRASRFNLRDRKRGDFRGTFSQRLRRDL